MVLVKTEARQVCSLKRNFNFAQFHYVVKPIFQEVNTEELCVAYLQIFDSLTFIKQGPEQIEILQPEFTHASRPIDSQLLKLIPRAEGIG